MKTNKITLDFEDNNTSETTKKKKLPKSFRIEKDEEEDNEDFEDESDDNSQENSENFSTDNQEKDKSVFSPKPFSNPSLDLIHSPKKTKPKMSMDCDNVNLDSGKTPIYEDKVSSDSFKPIKEIQIQDYHEIVIKELELKILEKQIELKHLSLENLPNPSNNLDTNFDKPSREKVEQGSVLKIPSFIPDPVLPDAFPERKQKRYFIRFWKNKSKSITDNQEKSKVFHLHTIPLVFPDLDSFDSMLEKDEIPLKAEDYSKLKRCPLCDSKLIKSKTQQENNLIFQKIKCKNKDCDYHKTIQFKL